MLSLLSLQCLNNYAFATSPIEEMAPTVKATLTEKEIQEKIEELFAEIIISAVEEKRFETLPINQFSSPNPGAGDIQPNQEFTGNPIYDLILLLVYGVYFIAQLAGSLVNAIVYAVTWVVQVLVSVFQDFSQAVLNLISFIINLVFAVLEIFLGSAANLIFYLLPLIIAIISIIFDDIGK